MKRILIGALAGIASPAHAAPGDLALGLFVGVPGEYSGAPIGAQHLPGGIIGRYELHPWRWLVPAITGGLGVPIASVGASLWTGLELRLEPIAHLGVYATPGIRTGLVGPGYYGRHSDVFVGFEYIYSGPWTIAPRLAIGLAAHVGRTEFFLEALAEAPLLPGPELLFGAGLGVRVRL